MRNQRQDIKLIRQNGKVMLSLEHADRIIGRIETNPTSFKVNEDVVKQDFKQGLQVHSHSEVTCFLNGTFSTFESTLVPCYQASVTFEVHGDGKLLFDSGRMGGKIAPEDIAIDVSGVQELKLIVTEGGNGWGGDWVMWANPLLTRKRQAERR